jgi:hypothetical protein
LHLKSPVQGARDIIIHDIYRPQGTSSFISNISHDSDVSDFFSTAPENSDVLFLRQHVLVDIFFGLILP